MNTYDELIQWIKKGTEPLFVAFLAVLYYNESLITSTELADIMMQIDMSYDTATGTLTYDSTDYTVYDMLDYTLTTDAYTDTIERSQKYMGDLIGLALNDSLLTSAQATTLEALL